MLIWALPAQIILIGGIATGTSLVAVALAIALSSLRLFPMVMAIAPYLRGTRRSLARDLFSAHFVAMTLWVEGQRLLPGWTRRDACPLRWAWPRGSAPEPCRHRLRLLHGGRRMPKHLAIGLLFLTPISFSVFMVRGASELMDWVALGLGFALTPSWRGSAAAWTS